MVENSVGAAGSHRRTRDFLSSLAFTLALIVVAEILYRFFDAPRLWALLGVFVVGYAVKAVVLAWRERPGRGAGDTGLE
ncbi:hypothetical protein [Zhihengliuella salsuginis]|uniref:Uncharacterized protein n=1 Tax=Zhihengliuella salsuginis TaxID=578222 RepID=A0ABQ3GM00_9MICC|nr:hypothetical protein [Zhihengliuella salsuginis]GHD11129.1 hypothetical protein GCM10008096_25400 [Zhihengliuella salsuginis]